MVGFINIPIIKYSVEWWNSLHQPASISKLEASSIYSPEMIAALLIMAFAYSCLFGWLSINGIRRDIAKMKAARSTAPAATATITEL